MLQDSHSASHLDIEPSTTESGRATQGNRPEPPRPALSTHAVRRGNLQTLLIAFSQEHIAAGQPAKGIEQAFAAHLQISPSMLSQIKRSRNISDSLAAQIERLSGKRNGWLSQYRLPDHGAGSNVDPAILTEEKFVGLARAFWHNASEEQRQQVAETMHTSLRAVAA